MLCPSCGRDLQKISVTTSSGGRFDVDHCGYCGGTWFDPYEINRIPFHEVMTLAQLTVLPQKKLTGLKIQNCPNDHKALEVFKGEAVPSSVKLLWCPHCLGIWATQKDLEEFKKHQGETISAFDMSEKFFPKLSVVFIPAMTFLFLILTTFSTIQSLQKRKDERIYAQNQITNLSTLPLSQDSIIITFNTTNIVSSAVSYGLSALELSEKEFSQSPAISHSFVLSNLIPQRQYYYRITLIDNFGRSFTSDLKTFVTP